MNRATLVEVNPTSILRDAGRTLGERSGAALAFANPGGVSGSIGMCVLFGHDGSPYLRVTSWGPLCAVGAAFSETISTMSGATSKSASSTAFLRVREELGQLPQVPWRRRWTMPSRTAASSTSPPWDLR